MSAAEVVGLVAQGVTSLLLVAGALVAFVWIWRHRPGRAPAPWRGQQAYLSRGYELIRQQDKRDRP